jgi:hypothetical protein
MNDIATAVLIFVLSFVVHVITHRLLIQWRILTVVTFIMYAPGGFVLIGITHSLPICAFLLYLLMTFTIFPFYLGVVLGGETPASTIMQAFRKKSTRSERELAGLFTEHGILGKRIEDLKSSGLIKKREDKYIATNRGRIVVLWFSWYQTVFAR